MFAGMKDRSIIAWSALDGESCSRMGLSYEKPYFMYCLYVCLCAHVCRGAPGHVCTQREGWRLSPQGPTLAVSTMLG